MGIIKQWKAFKQWQREQQYEPKSPHRTLCALEQWDFPDGQDLYVNIPSEGVSVFYGEQGKVVAIRSITRFLSRYGRRGL